MIDNKDLGATRIINFFLRTKVHSFQMCFKTVVCLLPSSFFLQRFLSSMYTITNAFMLMLLSFNVLKVQQLTSCQWTFKAFKHLSMLQIILFHEICALEALNPKFCPILARWNNLWSEILFLLERKLPISKNSLTLRPYRDSLNYYHNLILGKWIKI